MQLKWNWQTSDLYYELEEDREGETTETQQSSKTIEETEKGEMTMRKPMEELAKKIGEMKVMSKTKTERKERGRDNREMISNRIEIKTINKTYSKDKKV